ncbi:hypothetical protein [Staphylococcus simulans]
MFALENDIILKDQHFYHVMVDYFNGQVYERQPSKYAS